MSYLALAVRNLLRHGRRTLLLALAVGAVAFLLCGLAGLSRGTWEVLTDAATLIEGGHVNVRAYRWVNDRVVGVVSDVPRVEDVIREAVPEVAQLTERVALWATGVSELGHQGLVVRGVDIQREHRLRAGLPLVAGRMEDLAAPRTAVLFEREARRLGLGVGDSLSLVGSTLRGVTNSVDVRVVGIAKELVGEGEGSVFIPLADARELLGLRDDAASVVVLYLNDLQLSAGVGWRLREALGKAGFTVMKDDPSNAMAKEFRLAAEGFTGEPMDVSLWSYEIASLKFRVRLLEGLGVVVGLVLLALVSAGLLNLFWLSVRERTVEIGTLRALGMHRTQVMRMFLAEGFVMGLVASVAGCLGAAAVAWVVNAAGLAAPSNLRVFLMRDTFHLALQPSAAVAITVFITLGSTAASLLPSLRAARLQPGVALRHIG
ncbi:FtsX-like permease family protein [Myxococcaceae bacterium GXIMD 01537]